MSPRSDVVALPGQGVQRSTSFSYAQQAPHAQVQQNRSPQKQMAPQGQFQPPVQQQQQQQQQQPQQPSGPVYYETSFPAAPAAVFPDAPAAEPERDNVEPAQQPQEAMLIEL
jgi:growth factor-regulated tyrosine kinase substrate